MTVEAAGSIEAREFQATRRRLTSSALILTAATLVAAGVVLYFLRPLAGSIFADPLVVAACALVVAALPVALVVIENRRRASIKYLLGADGLEIFFGPKRILVLYRDITGTTVRACGDETGAVVTIKAGGRSYAIAPQDNARFLETLSARSDVPAEARAVAGWRAQGLHIQALTSLIALYLFWSAGRLGPAAACGMAVTGVALAFAVARRRWWEAPVEGNSNPRRIVGAVIGLVFILAGVPKATDWYGSPVAAIDMSGWPGTLSSPYLESETPEVSLIIPAGWKIGRSADSFGAWLAARLDTGGKRIVLVVSIPEKRMTIPGLAPGPQTTLQECQQTAVRSVAHAIRAYRDGSARSFTPMGYQIIMGQAWYKFAMPSILKDGQEAVTYWQPTRHSLIAITFEKIETNDPSLRALFKQVRLRK